METFAMLDLIETTLPNPEDRDALQYCEMAEFHQAVATLELAGLSAHQLQLLLGCPFSRFHDRQFLEVQVLALALQKHKVTVAQLHHALQEKEYRARLYHQTRLFETERLPSVEQVSSDLGLPTQAQLALVSVLSLVVINKETY